MNADKANFDSMVKIADLAEQWHHNRRQLEFRIMIAYTTLLALAIYQVSKPRVLNENFEIHWGIALTACLGLIGVLAIYCRWQYIFHIASNNDVRRRDFYLKKAEIILHHMSQFQNSRFVPHSTRTIIINLSAGDSREMSEVELFDKTGPDIYIPSRRIGRPPPKWYKNGHILIPLACPAFLTISLIVALFVKADIRANIIEDIIRIMQSLL